MFASVEQSLVPARRHRVSRVSRLASSMVLGYLRQSPFERGKWRLMRLVGPSLLVELEPGLYIRPLGLSALERELVRTGTHEPETIQAFAELLAPGMTVIDLGANIGQYTLVAARRVGPQGRVHAFEPTPSLAAHVRRNLELNAFDNATVHAAAVSDARGRAKLQVVETSEPNMNSIVRDIPANGELVVPTVTLDEFAAEHAVGPVGVIKIDIEGAEMKALRGARGLLTAGDSPILVLELNPLTLMYTGHSPDDLLGLLGSYGYAFYPIAVYNVQTNDPFLNGVAAKPHHFERFPALKQWQQRPISTWDSSILRTFKSLPLG
jgi:FkbM family methyltransferase